MEELGLVEKIEDYTIQTPISERSKEVIEPLLSEQWFVDMKPLAQPAIDVVKDGQNQIHPGTLRGHLSALDGKYPRLVHLPPTLVGPPHPESGTRRKERGILPQRTQRGTQRDTSENPKWQNSKSKIATASRFRPNPRGSRRRSWGRKTAGRMRTFWIRGSRRRCGLTRLWAGPAKRRIWRTGIRPICFRPRRRFCTCGWREWQ